ncbi:MULTISPECIES: SGNH/GDSL hydrolase family protein [Bifidobacterium]|nr:MULTISPECIES: SGNH/GDSL hydrolase family protein [Bifidobacterium]
MMMRDFSRVSINCLGDSTTWGDDGTRGGGPTISWPAHLQRLLGAGTVRNYGIKGCSVAKHPDRTDSFIERYGDMDPDADIVLVFGGVNDFNYGLPLGGMGDTDVRCFFGAVDTLIRGLVHRYPDADIVFMTSAKTGGVDHGHFPAFFDHNAAGLQQADYADAMKRVCAWYGVPVIDMFNESGMSALTPEHQPAYLPDGLHYSIAGYDRLARRVAAELLRFVAF